MTKLKCLKNIHSVLFIQLSLSCSIEQAMTEPRLHEYVSSHPYAKYNHYRLVLRYTVTFESHFMWGMKGRVSNPFQRASYWNQCFLYPLLKKCIKKLRPNAKFDSAYIKWDESSILTFTSFHFIWKKVKHPNKNEKKRFDTPKQ